ncbi:MAG: DNA translocase FtsK [Candidatus Margulisbacteria bacterium]|jgi:S-DNA-T family DNA segregation ATPase FtsK/SpoIIIE|nr:DNA translocase FtsK [Candidatus Margulisiibacteriota bacterium]
MKKEARAEITGGVLLVFALFIVLIFVYPQATGIVGEFALNFLLWPLFGWCMYLLPPLLLTLSLFLIFAGKTPKVGLRLSGLMVFLSCICALIEMFSARGPVEFMWPILHVYGGFLGNITALVLQKIFGPLGAYLLLLVLLLVSVLLIANYTVKDLLLLCKAVLFPARPPRSSQQSVPARYANRQRLRQQMSGAARQSAGQPPRPAPPPVPPPAPVLPPRPVPAVPPQAAAKAVMTAQDKERLRELRERLLAGRRARQLDAQPAAQPAQYIRKPGSYKLPPLKLLHPPVELKDSRRRMEMQYAQDKQLLETTLESFNVKARVTNVCQGPAVTRYELTPLPGVRVNKIANLADDISLSMASTVRIEAPVPGKSVVGIEVPNQTARPVNLAELAGQPEFNRHPLNTALGLDIAGNPVFCHIQEMPHLLVAGATGSGKSVCINSLIMSILLKASPQDVRFVMIDPKRVELANYNDIPHLVAPVVHEPQLAHIVLKFWAVKEMEKRYEIFTKSGVKNIEDFNRLAARHSGRTIQISRETAAGLQQAPYQIAHLPYVVIIIDELADLMMVGSRDVEGSICRLAQMGRATGMHLVIATQRPSVDVITGLIKANVPSRVAFAVGSQIDSRTIIDSMGAEKLLGKGDMLYSPIGARHVRRVQGVYVSDEEIVRVVRYIKMQSPAAYELDLTKLRQQAENAQDGRAAAGGGSSGGTNVRSDGRDVLFDQAVQLVQTTGKKSISYIQRKFRIGYNRAARIVEELEESGVLAGS